jgi:hypothetical protein
MKKLILVVALIARAVTPSHAEPAPTIAIIDSGTNPALFSGNIAYEVCVLSSPRCPNGKSFMEGAGASQLPATTNKDLNHGTQMVSVALRVNPAAQIIPIRIVGMTPLGNADLYSLDDVKNALDWVITNRAKFNISAVSLSQGKVFTDCKVPVGLAQQIATLKSQNVPVLAATGNDGNRTSTFSPACLPDAVAVGATDNPSIGGGIEYNKKANPTIANYSNGAQGQTDFFLNGRWNVKTLDGSIKFTVGTSNATAAMAAWWVMNKKATFDDTFNSLMATTVDAKNSFITGKYLPLP